MRNVAWHMLLSAMLACVQGCTSMSESGYSARYLPIMGSTGDLQYLPRACLAGDVHGLEDRLPPGCANALNLAEMVVSKGDLKHGQEMGPALVGPAADAVQRYLGVGREVEKPRKERLIQESRTSD